MRCEVTWVMSVLIVDGRVVEKVVKAGPAWREETLQGEREAGGEEVGRNSQSEVQQGRVLMILRVLVLLSHLGHRQSVILRGVVIGVNRDV